MENLILKQGDFVRIVALVGDLRRLGLSSGAVCLVESLGDGALGLKSLSGDVTLVNGDGTLTDACLDVTLHRCPVVTLARGIG